MMNSDFDVIIIGGGLSGLLLANRFASSGQKIALFEATEELGGRSKPYTSSFGEIDYELKYFPNVEGAFEAIEFLEDTLGEKVDPTLIASVPQTFDSGKMKDFVGFGDNSAKSCDEINYFAAAEHFEFAKPPLEWVKILKNKLISHENVQIFTKSTVSALNFSENKVVGATINANKTYTADKFIWACAIQSLASLMNEDVLPLRQKQKIAKTNFFASVHLDLIFSKEIYNQNSMLILQGANEEPLAGKFTLVGEHQLSQWICLVPNVEADSEEIVASLLKYMKRQISRAFEGIMESKVFERITLNNLTHGKISFDREDSKFGKTENLWVSQASLNPKGNLLGCLLEARKLWQQFSTTEVRSPEATI